MAVDADVPPTPAELAAYLGRREPVWQAQHVNPQSGSRVAIQCFLGEASPPVEYVTSVRALVYRGGEQGRPLELMVLRSARTGLHLLPGGQREAGETFEDTLCRELAEETGWTVGRTRIAGVIHVRQLTPRRPDFPYPKFPYPDWLNLVYAVEAGVLVEGVKEPNDVEAEAFFLPVDEIPMEQLGDPSEPSRGFLAAIRSGALVLR